MFKKLMMASVITSSLLVGANAQQGPEAIYKKKHQDWTVECYAAPNNQKDCQMFHQVAMVVPADKAKPKAEQRSVPVMRTSVTLYEDQPVMVFAAPLNVQLSEGLQLRLNKNDDKDGRIFVTVKGKDEAGKEKNIDTDIQQVNFERCTDFGCIAAIPMNVDISNKLLEKFQKGNDLFVNFTFDSSAKKDSDAFVKAKVPLKGFSDAYTDLTQQSK